MKRIALESVDHLNSLTANETNVLLIVSRNNCPGCDALQRALDTHSELQSALEGVTVAFAKLEKMPNIAQVFGLRLAPSMILFREDDEISRVYGFNHANALLDALREGFHEVSVAA